MKPIQLAIVEDNTVVRESLTTFFGDNPQFDLNASAISVESFLEMIREEAQFKPEILLLDIQLPGMTGLEGIPLIKEHLPEVNIIILTTFEDSDKIFAALCAGACSYITKQTSLSKILEAVLIVNRGGSYMSPGIARKVVEHFTPKPKQDSILTKRQQEIVDFLVEGMSYKMIAAQLDISIDTVRSHIMKIYRTLKINSKGELIRRMLEK